MRDPIDHIATNVALICALLLADEDEDEDEVYE